ncbi:MAG: D-alanyl-D-alanine carboxypeptidase family protein [Bryobacteraceae bacterium]
MVADLSTGKVLIEEDADAVRYPASLTKLMTLYLLFDAIQHGWVTLDQKLPVSSWAAQQPASRLGLRAGGHISVEDCINSLILRSANDVAMVVAEGLSGTEARFADAMTHTAHRLGMNQTVFRNPSGLPDPAHVSSARDILTLTETLITRFPQYYEYFGQRSCRIAGRTLVTHNSFLARYDGADGLKTGYTQDAGYNLVASVERGGHRLVGVVLGDSGLRARDNTMARVMDDSFAQLGIPGLSRAHAASRTARRGHRRAGIERVARMRRHHAVRHHNGRHSVKSSRRATPSHRAKASSKRHRRRR